MSHWHLPFILCFYLPTAQKNSIGGQQLEAMALGKVSKALGNSLRHFLSQILSQNPTYEPPGLQLSP
jgi:hypothetical protein